MNKLMKGCTQKGLAILLALVMMFPMFFVQSNAYSVDYTLPESDLPSLELGDAPASTSGAAFTNVTDDGKDWISLTNERKFEVQLPVEVGADVVNDAIKNDGLEWTLSRTAPYLSEDLFPNYNEGGDLSVWKTYAKDEKDKKALFDVVSAQAYSVGADTSILKMTLDCASYFDDGSIPQGTPSTQMMDNIGWYSLAAGQGGETLGTVAVKVVPYDHFRTMGEVYDELDALEAAGKSSGYYVKKFSMGKSERGYDMPYLIVAKSNTAVENWLNLCERAETEPDKVLADLANGTIKNTDYQVPVVFSNIHSNETSATDSILDFSWMLLGDKPISYNVLKGFKDAGTAQLADEMGPAGQEGSLAIPDLVTKTATYLGYIKGKNKVSGPVDLDTYYNVDKTTVKVADLLNDVFFILVPEENVEGRIYMSRVSSGGMDLNRDNSFQTQNETINMQKLIGTYNPVSLTELHGRIPAFQCEPCDPPHEPNFEYDLLARHLMTGGEAFGIAAVANNDGYNSYVIPQRDYLEYDKNGQTYWADPWDDMSTSYTPQFAMLHGCVGYTVELPAYNDETAKAAAYGQLGQAAYIAKEKKSYLESQLEIFKRGVNNANSDAFKLVGQWFCDQYDAEGAESELFRPEYTGEGENGNFYPECYIIPLDRENQSNLQAARDMMKWLSRNDVKILLTDKAFTYEGKTYPLGTMIVTMYQAKRSVANGALYDGTLIKNWTVLYSEGITTFNETRGFDMTVCAKPADYAAIKAVCGEPMDYEDCLVFLAKATSSLAGDRTGYQVIISNASEDSTAAVNELLKNGKTVGMITEGRYRGDFICSYGDWLTVCDDFILTGTCISSNYPDAKKITGSPVVYINGLPADSDHGYVGYNLINAYNYNYDRQAMDLLNFETTDDPAEADVIIGCSALDSVALPHVQKGTPYIGYGSAATGTTDRLGKDDPTLGLNKFFGGISRKSISGSMDALAYVTYPEENLVNASYVADGDDVMYGYGAGYFSSAPEGAEVLVSVDGSREPTEGFLRSIEPADAASLKAFLNGSIQGFSYQGKDKNDNDINVAFFANSLTHKVHQRDEYAFISNFAFANMLGDKYTATAYHSNKSHSSNSNDTAPSTPTQPAITADNGITPEEAKQLAAKTFTDVKATDWYAESVGHMIDSRLMNGTTPSTFAPNALFDRGMMATILYRLAGSPAVTGSAPFSDVQAGSWYSSAVTWAASVGIVNGYNGSYGPGEPITREQVVTTLYRYAKYSGMDLSGTGSLAGFTDSSRVSDFAAEAMSWAVGSGIVSGTTGATLNPQATATRAELATMLMRFIDLTQK
ncbi:MAG TPA: M14 family metallopeptidase [Bacillota bacterium]|nr:M14 family metallopeptidase [Bacillota bacterium]